MLLSVLFIVCFALLKGAECVAENGDCTNGGKCDGGTNCFVKHMYFSQCLRSCPGDWYCAYARDSSYTIEYAACTGGKKCTPGVTCFAKDQYYAQCLRSCPSGWQCTTVGPAPSAPSGGQAPSAPSTSSSSRAVTNDCTFGFGSAFDGNNRDYSHYDFATIWIGTPSTEFGTNFNKYWHGDFLRKMVALNKLPVFYTYIIAFMARHEAGLKDCDVGTPSLCQRGAQFIRNNRQGILNKYSNYAQETAAIVGTQSRMIWLIEVDFYQYYSDTHQEGGTLTGEYARALFDDIVRTIKRSLPNARISWDVSPWATEDQMRRWWGFFATAQIDFIHTSDGVARADIGQIKSNELSYRFVTQLTGRKMLADTGYGVAGASTGHNDAWDSAHNIGGRQSDGVISVTQANPRGDWVNTIRWLKSNLGKVC